MISHQKYFHLSNSSQDGFQGVGFSVMGRHMLTKPPPPTSLGLKNLKPYSKFSFGDQFFFSISLTVDIFFINQFLIFHFVSKREMFLKVFFLGRDTITPLTIGEILISSIVTFTVHGDVKSSNVK